MMDLAFKGRVVAALRSGKYKQGRYLLRRGDHYCPLGVMLDIKRHRGWKKPTHHDHGYTHIFGVSDALVSGTFIAETGIKPERIGDLTDMNDRGVPFDEIADWIEREL